MLFNSYIFILVFLPVTITIYGLLKKYHDRETAFVFLVVASLVYYAYWKMAYLPILLLSIIINFQCGKFLSNTVNAKIKRMMLVIAIILNLAMLAYYKYAGFILDNIEKISGTEFTTLKRMFGINSPEISDQILRVIAEKKHGVKPLDYNHVNRDLNMYLDQNRGSLPDCNLYVKNKG